MSTAFSSCWPSPRVMLTVKGVKVAASVLFGPALKLGAKGREAIVFAHAPAAWRGAEREALLGGATVGRARPGGHRVRGHVRATGRRAGQGRGLAAVEFDLDRVEGKLRGFVDDRGQLAGLAVGDDVGDEADRETAAGDSASRKIR